MTASRDLFGQAETSHAESDVNMFDLSARLVHETNDAFLIFDGAK